MIGDRLNLSARPVSTRSYNPGKKKGVRRSTPKNGYAAEWCPERQKYVYQHRLVMEQVLGRFLDRSEVVHHVNGNRLDNRPENLELTTASEHKTLHHPEIGSGPRPHTRLRPVPCVICGKHFIPYQRRDRKRVEVCSKSCGQKRRWLLGPGRHAQ